MNKIKHALVLIIIAFNFFVTQAQEPKNLDKLAFKLLRHISKSNSNYFKSNTVDFQDFKAMGRNENLVKNEKARELFEKVTPEEYKKEVTNTFFRINEGGAQKGIIWNKIKFVNFLQESKVTDPFVTIKGRLYFKSDENTYSIDVTFILTNKGYKVGNFLYLTKFES